MTTNQPPDPAQPAMRFSLVEQRGPSAGRRHVLAAGVSSLGRSKHADIQVDDRTVGKQHTFFRTTPYSCELADGGSSHPSVVNGVGRTRAFLRHGDVIIVGSTEYLVDAEQIDAEQIDAEQIDAEQVDRSEPPR